MGRQMHIIVGPGDGWLQILLQVLPRYGSREKTCVGKIRIFNSLFSPLLGAWINAKGALTLTDSSQTHAAAGREGQAAGPHSPRNNVA